MMGSDRALIFDDTLKDHAEELVVRTHETRRGFAAMRDIHERAEKKPVELAAPKAA
jgi:hypothetical protein